MSNYEVREKVEKKLEMAKMLIEECVELSESEDVDFDQDFKDILKNEPYVWSSSSAYC